MVRTPINPPEGLKLLPTNPLADPIRVRTPINPPEGLKRYDSCMEKTGEPSENAHQPARGIETIGASPPPVRRPAIARVRTPINPPEGLKPALWRRKTNHDPVRTPINPPEGLKRVATASYAVPQLRENAHQPARGIETCSRL